MIEKYVVSLELAKRMRELGWKKKTLFGWYLTIKSKQKVWQLLSEYPDKTETLLELRYTPLFAEIWEELPYEANGIYDLQIIKNCKNETIIYYYEQRTRSRIRKPYETPFHNINPVEVAGEMWCWLVENKYLEV